MTGRNRFYILKLFFSIFLSFLILKYFFRKSLLPSVDMRELLEGKCVKDCDDNQDLIEHIKTVLVSPSGTGPVLINPEAVKTQRGQTGQVDVILKHFNDKRNGFFIEAGAWDGEQLSNTIYMETELGWNGLLVEPNKGIFDVLVGKKRNAFSVNSCLSRSRYAEQVNFDTADVYGAIENYDDPGYEAFKQVKTSWKESFLHKEVARETVVVQCFPLYSILLALGNPKVDFMSLDIEGSEMDVLKTIPFDKVDIEMFLIETDKSNVTAMTDLMAQAGYEVSPLPPYDHLYIKKLRK